jgi:hypothetical protein
LESQRVKFLIEGYLRGWLDFDYRLSTSKLREDIVLDYIENERLYSLLQNRLLIETVLRGAAGGSSKLDPIFEVSRSLIGLKLPSALPKDTINKDAKNKSLSKEDIQEWKQFLTEVNKSKK